MTREKQIKNTVYTYLGTSIAEGGQKAEKKTTKKAR